jgi:hypothetical protein
MTWNRAALEGIPDDTPLIVNAASPDYPKAVAEQMNTSTGSGLAGQEGNALNQPHHDRDPWQGIHAPEPAEGLTAEEEAEEAEYYDYWDHMQLAYNYDWLDPDTNSAHAAAFCRLAGWPPGEAERLARNEAEHAGEYEAEP